MTLAVIVLLCLLSFLLVWQFVGYPLLMGLVALRAKPVAKDYTYTPFVSIVVPAYNEERVIAGRVENLDTLEYPKDKYEIIIVESGSTDRTSHIVERKIADRGQDEPSLKLVKESDRRGKASAINVGKEHARGEIVLVTDANASFEEGVLRELAPHFADPTVGAVGGRYVIANRDQGLALQESFYWDLEYIMRIGESALDSACLFHGEINAWRNCIVEADTQIVSEDLDMAIQIRRKGYRIVYEPRAVAYEYTGATPREQIIRRKKVATGTMLCIRKHLDYFVLPRDLYSAFIFPSHKGLVMLSPYFLLATLVLYLFVWDIKIVAFHFLATTTVFAVLFGALMVVRSRLTNGEISRPGKGGISVGSLAKIAYYVLLNEYLLLLAWKDFVLGRYSVLWERADSTRHHSPGDGQDYATA
jgi:biofilm PGA synthesis N-glycosyltransferase PgaC